MLDESSTPHLDHPHDETRPSWNTTIVIAGLTLVGSIIASSLLYKATTESTVSSATQAFMLTQATEITSLRKELRELRNEVNRELVVYKEEASRWRLAYIALLEENLTLKQDYAEINAKLSVKINEAEIVRQWMDDMPFEGWAKRFNEDGELIIIALNKRFTESYGLTRDQAIGKTDKELFTQQIADQYLETDYKVITTGVPSVQVDNFIMPDGEVIDIRNIKWRIEFADGTYGSAGMVIKNI